MIEAEAVIHRDVDAVAETGRLIFERYGGGSADEHALEALRAQAAKRVALEFLTIRLATWDHGKLGGAY